MASRTWLFLAAAAFGLTAVAGALLLYLEPNAASLGSILLAIAFSLVCLHLATRPAPAVHGCGSCGALRDLSLSFCARCGASG